MMMMNRRTPPKASSVKKAVKAMKKAVTMTFTDMDQAIETATVAAASVKIHREEKREARIAAKRAEPVASSSYVHFPHLAGGGAGSSSQLKPLKAMDFKSIAKAAAALPEPIRKSQGCIEPYVAINVKDAMNPDFYYEADFYGHDFDERNYRFDDEEGDGDEEYVTDEYAGFGSKRAGDNSDW